MPARHADGMSIWQFTRFRVSADREPAVLRARGASLQPCWTARPELQAAYLIQLAEGDWLDITVWAGHAGDAADERSADPALPASRTVFFDLIEELIGEESGVIIREDRQPDRHLERQPEHQPGRR